MDTNFITWIFFGVLALFIFFMFKKFLPFKQDARSVNYYHTEQYPVKEKVMREIRTVRKESKSKPSEVSIIEKED